MNVDLLKAVEKLDLPFPWETNARGQIIMTPVNYDHCNHVTEVDRILARLAPDWKTGVKLGIHTSDGVKAPDLIVASPDYHARHKGRQGYVTEAPEICIEVMSPLNSWQEMREKIGLYFEVGAQEVWIVDTDGKIAFFTPGGETLKRSRLIPDMPASM